MSYILDALRKADAERERDPARGIHAQPVQAALSDAAGTPRRALLLLGGGAVLAAAAVLLWPRPPAQVPVAVVPPPAPAAALPAAVAAPPAPAEAVLPPQPPREAPPARAIPAVAKAPAAPALPAATPAAGDAIVALNELPAELQRELPKLAISGGVFSQNAAQRMLIVGGQVVNEGAELAPGLVLEQIRAKSAVLRFRGWRYSVGY